MEEVTRSGEGREVFVDSSAWVALFYAGDQAYEPAVSIWGRIRKGGAPLVTTDYVLDESVTLLLTRAGHAASIRAGRAIMESAVARLIFLDESAIRAAWDTYQRYSDKSYSFTDVTSFLVMESLGIRRAFTFDRHFAQAGFQVLDAD